MSGVDHPAERQCCFCTNPTASTEVASSTSTVAALQNIRTGAIRRPAGPPTTALATRTTASSRDGDATTGPVPRDGPHADSVIARSSSSCTPPDYPLGEGTGRGDGLPGRVLVGSGVIVRVGSGDRLGEGVGSAGGLTVGVGLGA